MSSIDQALDLASKAHHGQKYGVFPYMIHPITVVREVTRHFPNVSEDTRIVAMLHDVVEDTDVTFEDISEAGFSDDVVEALKLLTRNKNDTYKNYVRKIVASENLIAMRVKYCDAFSNRHFDRDDKKSSLEKRYDWVMWEISEEIEIIQQKPLCI